MTYPLLNNALELYDLGFSIFPLKPRDKHPIADLLPLNEEGNHSWTPYQTVRATRDQVLTWWNKLPDANIAIATGAVSGCIVIDVDGPDGVESLKPFGKMPKTPVVKTGRGYHIYFKHPGFPVSNKVGLLPGIDVRGDGGYVVAAPSIHPSGVAYSQKVVLSVELAVIPSGLLDLLKPQERSIPKRPRLEQSEDDTVRLAQAALDALDVWRRDNYQAWTEVGMTLAGLGTIGLSLWESWSAGSDKYKSGECERKWRTFDTSGLGIGSLFKWADDDSGTSWRPRQVQAIDTDDRLNIVRFEPEPLPQDILWADGLPVAVRASLNRNCDPAVAPVLELLNEAINAGMMKPDSVVDVEFVKCVSETLKRNVSITTIRRGLIRGEDYILRSSLHYSITIQENPIAESLYGTHESCKLPKKAGRHPNLYQLLPRDQILANVAKLEIIPILQKHFPMESPLLAPLHVAFLEELGKSPEEAERLKNALEERYGDLIASQPGYSAALQRARAEYRRFLRHLSTGQGVAMPSGWIYPKSCEYVACCARAFLESAGGTMQIGRKELANRIGCTERNLNAVLKRANIHWEKLQFSYKPILSWAQAAAIQYRYDSEQAGFPLAFTSTGRESVIPFDDADCREWIEKELLLGSEVSLRYWQANKQVADPGLQPCQVVTALPRLLYATVAFMRGLLNRLLALLTPLQPALIPEPEQPEPTPIPEPVARFKFKPDFFHMETLRRVINWLYVRLLGRGSYGETQVTKLIEMVKKRPVCAGIVDADTGEIQPYSVQLGLDALLGDSLMELRSSACRNSAVLSSTSVR